MPSVAMQLWNVYFGELMTLLGRWIINTAEINASIRQKIHVLLATANPNNNSKHISAKRSTTKLLLNKNSFCLGNDGANALFSLYCMAGCIFIVNGSLHKGGRLLWQGTLRDIDSIRVQYCWASSRLSRILEWISNVRWCFAPFGSQSFVVSNEDRCWWY